MDFHFLVVDKSWKINVGKEGAPCVCEVWPNTDVVSLVLWHSELCCIMT